MEHLVEKRTDLALEAREQITESNEEIEGVILKKQWKKNRKLKVTTVIIKDEHGQKIMKKLKGTYITIELAPEMLFEQEFCEPLIDEMKQVILGLASKKKIHSVLVTGLGNRDVTPDALGPLTVDHVKVTRHLMDVVGELPVVVSAIAPGVTGQTGMEMQEIVQGIIEEISPELVLVVDALAARSVSRLNCTIQMTDTGISPGSGVGNHRKALNKESLGCPVIAIGVPTVVDASTIVEDRMEQALVQKGFTEKEIRIFLSELKEVEMENMFVTPRNIDETVRILSKNLGEAINRCFGIAEIS